jgi:hypothetical protein
VQPSIQPARGDTSSRNGSTTDFRTGAPAHGPQHTV